MSETSSENNLNIQSLSFEQSLSELNKIINQLENGEIELDSAIALFEQGNKLREHCEKIIADARLKIDKIVNQGEKIVGEEPFKVNE